MNSGRQQAAFKLLQQIDYISIFALLFLYVAGAGLILFGKPQSWVDLLSDDAYYYLGVVRNIVEHGISSFLPPFKTNGYQPLWAVSLSATASVFGTSKISLVFQAFSLSFVFVGLFAYLSKRSYGLTFPAIASSTVFYAVTLWGMETTMMPVFILAFFSARSWKSRGLFSSLIFLTRLDALALIIARDGYFYLAKKEREYKHYLILAPVLVVYFLVNYKMFGSPVPISGLAKSVGNVSGENVFAIFRYAAFLKSALLLFFGVSAASLLINRKILLKFKDELAILLLADFVICAYYATRSGWPIWEWYSWPAMMIFFYLTADGALSLADSFGNLNQPGIAPWKVFAISLMVIALFCYAMIPAAGYSNHLLAKYYRNQEEAYPQKNLELVNLIRQGRFPAGTFFAMGDRAGSFGFFLGNEYKFLHTEGLVGPYAYYDYMKRDRGAQFLEENKINYLIAERDRFFESGEILGVAEPVQGLSSHTGPYLLCFNKNSIVLDQTYLKNGLYSKRYMFDYSKAIRCPDQMTHDFEDMRTKYGSLRIYTLYSEYPQKRNWLLSGMAKFINLPPGW